MFNIFNNSNETKLRDKLDEIFDRIVKSAKKEIYIDFAAGTLINGAILTGRKHMYLNIRDLITEYKVPENRVRTIIEECTKKAQSKYLESGTY